MTRYGERLRELRAERQLSLREVEERGGPSKDTMSLTERGVHRPHPRTLGKIAQALGMSVSDLQAELEGADSPKAPMTSVEEVLDAADAATQWAALSDEEWEAELENTEDPRDPVLLPWGAYAPMGLGPVARGWQPRRSAKNLSKSRPLV